EALCRVWAEVLGVSRVGVTDNFFELGGHSLLATQVLSRAREAARATVALRELFRAPTVGGLALALGEGRQKAEEAQGPPLVAVARTQALPLSFSQERLWFLRQLEPESAAYHLPVVLKLLGTLDEEALEKAFVEVVRRHEALRTTFAVEG